MNVERKERRERKLIMKGYDGHYTFYPCIFSHFQSRDLSVTTLKLSQLHKRYF